MATPARPRTVAEPWIGKLPRRERVIGGRKVEVGFAAIDKIAILPIKAAFEAARDATRMGRIVLNVAPFISQRRSQIRSSPAEGVRRCYR
jgi:hypothetical protein